MFGLRKRVSDLEWDNSINKINIETIGKELLAIRDSKPVIITTEGQKVVQIIAGRPFKIDECSLEDMRKAAVEELVEKLMDYVTIDMAQVEDNVLVAQASITVLEKE